MEDGAGTLQNSLVVLQKVKVIVGLSSFTPGYRPRERKACLRKNLYMNVDGDSSIIHNSQRVEITPTPISTNEWINKVQGSCSGILSTIKNTDTGTGTVLIHSGCYNKIPHWLTYKQQVSFSVLEAGPRLGCLC